MLVYIIIANLSMTIPQFDIFQRWYRSSNKQYQGLLQQCLIDSVKLGMNCTRIAK